MYTVHRVRKTLKIQMFKMNSQSISETLLSGYLAAFLRPFMLKHNKPTSNGTAASSVIFFSPQNNFEKKSAKVQAIPSYWQALRNDTPCVERLTPILVIHPLKRAFSALNIDHPKRRLIYQPSIFRCYVSFREGIMIMRT